MTPPTSRTVRFAPLPDPRRSNDARDFSDASSSSNDSNLCHNSKRSSFPLESYHPAAHEQKSSFLRPFFKKHASSGSSSPSSSISLTPTSSIDPSHPNHHSRRFTRSAEKILTLGAINLFRSNSRSSDSYSDPSRWPTTTTTPHSALLGRPHSSSSAGDNDRSNKRRAPSTEGTSASASFMSQNPPRKGKRMLNGRVYGAGKRSGDPFANIKSDAEPEFVEWGYGGMGSVRGQHAAGMSGTRWERLHGGDEDPSFDDGSGMGWVKKRREAKERERKAKEQEKAGNEGAATPKPLSSSSSHNQIAGASAFPPEAPFSTPLSPADVLSEHDLRAVTIPANFQRHHHHHRSASRAGTITAEPSSETNTSPTHNSRVVDDRESESEVSESSSSSELPGDEDDEETDSEPERKTALGAGVEKYTRHKDIGRDKAPSPIALAAG